jgi:UPF0755 protein
LLCVGGTIVHLERHLSEQQLAAQARHDASITPPFPVGVDPVTRRIIEQPAVTELHLQYLAVGTKQPWWQKAITSLANQRWYQQVASPVTRTFVIWAGQRQEEIIAHISGVAGWSSAETEEFRALISSTPPIIADGTLYPGHYVIHRGAAPADVFRLIHERFTDEIYSRYPTDITETLPLSTILTIASLLEREARDFTDMRIISGIIWNRLFSGMPLQLDATLQYARVTNGPIDGTWWPTPRPADKFIDSPFNTYQHTGLPPSPIANPSAEAVLAALNPRATSCLFYLHTDDGRFFCSETYEEHNAQIARHLR